jgi:hypothetical protein
MCQAECSISLKLSVMARMYQGFELFLKSVKAPVKNMMKHRNLSDYHIWFAFVQFL